MSNLDALRAGGVAHGSFVFSKEDVARFDSLSREEVAALISAREKLGHALCTIRDDSDPTHPDTVPI